MTTITRRPGPAGRWDSPRRRASIRDASRTTSSGAFDLGAKAAKARVELLIAPVDLLDVVDHARPLRAERRREERHARPDVRTAQLGPVQLRRTDDHGAVRVAEDEPSPHALERTDPV